MVKLFEITGKGRDKAKDDSLFNCSEEYEIDYVASRYGSHHDDVKAFLKEGCEQGKIRNLIHTEVYALIEKQLGLSAD